MLLPEEGLSVTRHGDAGTGEMLSEKGLLLLFLHSCPLSLAVFTPLLSSLLVNSVSHQNLSTMFLLGMRLAELAACFLTMIISWLK